MPWQPDGTFLRVNPDYSATVNGELWGQDLAAIPSIKIIASRHDYHDQDIGDGIAQCLNLTGYNSMLANLKMGSFKITELGDATLLTDAPNYGQVSGSMLFDDGLRKLELFDRDGTLIDDVTIPSGAGGGGEGTVTEVNVDATLVATPNPIVNIGTIGMKFLAAGQTFSGGISDITLDDYGRVTQVTTGAFANTNLSNTQTASSVTVQSSTGNDTIIQAANALPGKAGVMTSTMADQLAQLWAAGAGGGMQPPTELHGIAEGSAADILSDASLFTEQSTTFVDSAPAWTNLLNLTGSGLVNFLGVELGAQFDVGVVTKFSIVVDGNEVWLENDALSAIAGHGKFLVGFSAHSGKEGGSLDQVAFNTSFVLRCKPNISTPDNEIITYFKYQKFS